MPSDTPTDDDPDQDTDPVELADPDDYHRSQRLKEIHQARQTVTDTLNKMEISNRDGYSPAKADVTRLSHAVAAYVTELQPVTSQADIDDGLTKLPENSGYNTIHEYSTALGHKAGGGGPANMYETMQVFRQANQILAEIKPLIETDENTRWEI